jgi:hypothetical protein
VTQLLLDPRQIVAAAHNHHTALDPDCSGIEFNEISRIGFSVLGIVELTGPFIIAAALHIHKDLNPNQGTAA